MGSRELSRPAAFLLLLCAVACGGPRPRVSDVRVTPSPSPGHYRVEALVWNEAGGEGEISVEIRLQDVSSGRTIQQERQLQLRGRDRVTLVVDVAAPAATYRADVRAEYPPQ